MKMKIIGLTGTIGSGKEVVREILEKNFNAYTVVLSSLLKEDALKKQGIKITREIQQNLGDELRKQYGPEILAKIAVSFMQKDKDMLIIDGIRNPGESDFLKTKFGDSYKLIAVDAQQKIRFERTVKRGRPTDPKILEEFVKLDDREQGKDEPDYGLQIRKCIEMADIVLQNDGSLEEFQKKVTDVIKEF